MNFLNNKESLLLDLLSLKPLKNLSNFNTKGSHLNVDPNPIKIFRTLLTGNGLAQKKKHLFTIQLERSYAKIRTTCFGENIIKALQTVLLKKSLLKLSTNLVGCITLKKGPTFRLNGKLNGEEKG